LNRGMVSHPEPLFSPQPFIETRQQLPLPQQQQLPKQQQRTPHGLLLCCVCHEHNTTFRYEVVYKTAAASLSTLTLHQPGLDFINILRKAFLYADPKSIKIQPSCQYLFSILGSAHVEAVCKMLMKLTPGLVAAIQSLDPEPLPQRCQSVRITELNDDGQEIDSGIKEDTSLVLSQTVSPVGTVSLFSDDQSHEYYNFPPRHPRHGHLKWPVWTPNPSPIPNSGGGLVATYPDYPIHIPTVTLKRISSSRKGKLLLNIQQVEGSMFLPLSARMFTIDHFIEYVLLCNVSLDCLFTICCDFEHSFTYMFGYI